MHESDIMNRWNNEKIETKIEDYTWFLKQRCLLCSPKICYCAKQNKFKKVKGDEQCDKSL